MTHHFMTDIYVFIGGLFFYGARAAIGKWLFQQLLRLLRWSFVRSESEVRLYQQFVREAHAKKRRLE